MKFAIYTSLYFVNKYKIDFVGALTNYLRFGDEVSIAIPTEGNTDDTFASINAWWNSNRHVFLDKKLNIHLVDISFSNNRFDGLLKDYALQHTNGLIKIHMDGDERFVLSQRGLWDQYAELMLKNQHVDALFIPSIDLWGGWYYIRSDKPIGVKWRMHKEGFRRGVVKFAELGDGLIDTSKSDTCELIDQNGDLVKTLNVVPQHLLRPEFTDALNYYPYTLHLGYLDLKKRAEVTNMFWKPHWENRSGKEEDVELSEENLTHAPVLQHQLALV